MLRTLIGTALLAATTALYAQAPAPAEKPRGARYDCAKAADPKACEERRAKAREAVKKAHAACDAKPRDERRDCMRKEMCAQAKDPAQCESRAKAHAEKRKQRAEERKNRMEQNQKK